MQGWLPGGIAQFLTGTLVSISSCPPAYVVGGHDVQHLGGLYPHQVVIILQQGLQALQAACGHRKPFEHLPVQQTGQKSTRDPVFSNGKVPHLHFGFGGAKSVAQRLLVEGVHNQGPFHLIAS